jgi:dTDP-4-amino-4,6-dideoxygalactose transaminase
MTPRTHIPFHRPLYDKADEAALVASLRSGAISGDGEYTRIATTKLSRLLQVESVLLTPSCTHALELAMMTLRLQPDDEVIVPSFTFVSTTNCILREGARVVLADIRPDTLTLDLDDVERKVTGKTRAIITVSYAGVMPDVNTLATMVSHRDVQIIEDAAQAIGATYKGRPQGTLGDIGCFSFHETKIISTGEGGAFVTNNAPLATLAEIMREKGTNRKQFLMHLVDKYTWVDVGSSFLPVDSMGALLSSQLEKLTPVIAARKGIHDRYMNAFQELASRECITLPTIPGHIESNYHIFYVLMKNEETRNAAIQFFQDRGIGTTFHYLPLHLSRVGRERLSYQRGDFPVTELVSGRLLRLPIYPSLSSEEQDRVISTMHDFVQVR